MKEVLFPHGGKKCNRFYREHRGLNLSLFLLLLLLLVLVHDSNSFKILRKKIRI